MKTLGLGILLAVGLWALADCAAAAGARLNIVFFIADDLG